MPHATEHAYDLTPVQQNWLAAQPESAATQPTHMRCRLSGVYNAPIFRRAWEHVMCRHPALRAMAVASHAGALNEYAPLPHVTTHSATDHELVWSFPAVALDRSSAALVLQEALDYYAVYSQGYEPLLETVESTTLSSYVLHAREAENERFWRATLRQRPLLSLLGETTARRSPVRYAAQGRALTPAVRAHLQGLERSEPGAAQAWLCAAWALVLRTFVGRNTVLFGVETIAQSPDAFLAPAVGRFETVLPLCAHIEPHTSARHLVNYMRALESAIATHANTTLDMIKCWGGFSAHACLFDSAVARTSYHDHDAPVWGGPLALEQYVIDEMPSAALTLSLDFDSALALGCVYDARVFTAYHAGSLLAQTATTLAQIVASADTSVLALTNRKVNHAVVNVA